MKQELFKRVHNHGNYRDVLTQLHEMCPCGSGAAFKHCCGARY